LTPPETLIFSTSIRVVFSSGAPRNEAGPVTEKIAPIFTGSAGGAGEQPGVNNRAASEPSAANKKGILFISFHV
jgi:hypothetical protein